VQGAMSLWSFASDILAAPGSAGYFKRVLADKKVRGPVVATLSKFDTAVGDLYPWAAGLWRGGRRRVRPLRRCRRRRSPEALSSMTSWQEKPDPVRSKLESRTAPAAAGLRGIVAASCSPATVTPRFVWGCSP
jgi:hypothetical protein